MSPTDFETLSLVCIGAPDPEIVQLEARIRRAQLDANVNELEAMISEDLLFAGPDGQLGTKAQDLEAYKSGVIRFVSHDPKELRVRRVGDDAALVSLLTDLSVSVNGNVSTGRYRYMRVWAREKDRVWRVAGGQVCQAAG